MPGCYNRPDCIARRTTYDWRLEVDRREFVADVLADGAYRVAVPARDDKIINALSFPNLAINLAGIWNWENIEVSSK